MRYLVHQETFWRYLGRGVLLIGLHPVRPTFCDNGADVTLKKLCWVRVFSGKFEYELRRTALTMLAVTR